MTCEVAQSEWSRWCEWEAVKKSILVEAAPGGCLYWNSDVWHTHETVGPEV